jgi:hypothetical protein
VEGQHREGKLFGKFKLRFWFCDDPFSRCYRTLGVLIRQLGNRLRRETESADRSCDVFDGLLAEPAVLMSAPKMKISVGINSSPPSR